jgi:PAP2 superfamily
MTYRRRARLAALAATVALIAPATVGGVAASPAHATSSETVVTHWNRVAVETLLAFPPPGGGAPPASQINMGMTEGAVYDAIDAIDRTHEPYLLTATFPATASKAAAVATAAHDVLTYLIATMPAGIAFDNASVLQARIDGEYATTLAEVPDGRSETDGIATGHAAASAMIASRQGDGRFGPSLWQHQAGIGYWDPLLPNGSAPLDPTPWVGGVRPFLMTSSSQFRTDGPNALTSAAYAQDVNEVQALGSVNSTVRTPAQTHVALFWQSNPVANWNVVARSLVEDPDRNVSLDDSALLFAMENLAGADAAINCWNDKYFWDFWRPWTAIHEAGNDGNPDTQADPSWAPLITAPYPEHPSGHLCLDGSHLRVFQMFFGTDKVSFTATSLAFPGETRPFDRFSAALKEIINARIWAGLHFRTADVQAQNLGKKVAYYLSKQYFQPL